MKRIIYISLLSISFLLSACQTDSEAFSLVNGSLDHPVNFVGNSRHHFSTEYQSGRSVTHTLESGHQISVFSKGAFNADAVLLQYDGKHWLGTETCRWEQSSGSADIVAYYPAITSAAPTFYDAQGLLQDFTYSKGTYAAGQPVQLEFSHLFSEISFQFCQSINDDLSSVRFLISKKVAAIDCYTSEYTLQDNRNEYLTFTKHASGNYTFFVPSSSSDIEIQIEVQTLSGKIRKVSLVRPFRRNVTYRCNINERKTEAGIYTADDFIAFVQLYNGDHSSGRSLSEFGSMEQGKQVYKLMNSISFTPEQSAKVTEIGHFSIKSESQCRPFKDVFDGQHFTLYGLKLVNRKSESAALFSFNTGTIRNLVIDNMHISTQVNVVHTISPLCGKSRGVIHDCMVRNSEVQALSLHFPSGLVGVNGTNALLYNCAVENTTIVKPKDNNKISSGMVFDNYGSLLNSYVSDCILSTGAFLCGDNYCEIRGCYTYSSAVVANPDLVNTIPAICYVNEASMTIWNCFFQFPYGTNYIYTNKGGDKTHTNGIRYHHENFKTPAFKERPESLLVDRLNENIDNELKTRYPDISFTRWTKSADSNRPIFVH